MALEGVRGQRVADSQAFKTQKIKKTEVQKTELKNNQSNFPSDKKVPDLQVSFKKNQLISKLPQQQQTPNQLGDLKEGDKVPVSISENDTQSDVLKNAYTEFGKKAGLSDPEGFAATMVRDGDKIYHQNSNTQFTDAEFSAKKNAGSINMVPTASDMTALRQAKINELTSYGVFDWSVTSAEQKQTVDILKNDPNLSATIKVLESNGNLSNLINRIDDTEQRRELIGLLGKNLDDEAAQKVLPHIEKLDVKVTYSRAGKLTEVSDNLWQARFNLARLGVEPTSTNFDRSKYADLINADGSSPFSGVGGSGTNPTQGNVPFGDKWSLWRDDSATVQKYSNPIGPLQPYLDNLGPTNRVRQAELLLNQPISTTMPEIYDDKLPTRADVIKVAAKKYNLQPELIAGFILAEQRDQSKNEDAKDYTAATAITQANTSIGLGQVVISTAEKNKLFSDLMSDNTQKNLKQNDVARIFADDTANIFAVAKYLRQTADQGASKSLKDLLDTQRTYPKINMSDYKKNSSQWSMIIFVPWVRKHFRALG